MSLHTRVLEVIRRKKLWKEGERVCVAVSGGLDSMVLLDVLHRTQRGHKGILQVCTIDHQLRTESQQECLFVQEQCHKRQIPIVMETIDLPKGGNLYQRARELRQKVLENQGCRYIATGHHQNDQAETILYRLIRGSGLEGLAGMTLKTDPWCRPLLLEHKEALLEYAQEMELSWVEDPSNRHSLRGHLREIIPLLDALQVHGSSVSAMARSATLLREDAILLEQVQKECWQKVFDGEGLHAELFYAQHRGLQLRLLRMLCVYHKIPVRAATLIRFIDERKQVLLPHNTALGHFGHQILLKKE